MASSSGIIIILLFIVLIGLLGGLVYYFLVLKKKSSISSPSKVPGPSQVTATKSSYVKPETTKISIPTNEAVQNQKNAPFDVNREISHKERMAEFYRQLPSFGKDSRKILQALEGINFERLDRGKLKDILERQNGFTFEESDYIINSLQKKYEEEQAIELIEKEYPHYKRMGMEEGAIRIHFKKKGYSDSVIQEASRRFHQKNIFENYIDQLVKHMKVHLLAGKTDSEVQSLFLAHNWPEELVKEALEKTKVELEKEHSVVYLQELILLQLLEGEPKTKIVKALIKQGWPEDELKREYNDLDEGLSHLENALQMIDLNDYNLAKVKRTLKEKNWPEEIIDMTIQKLQDDISYHKKLNILNKEVDDLFNKGYTASQIRNYLESQHWDRIIISKIIHRLNKRLSKEGDKEKIKQFNDTVFVEDEWHKHINEVVEPFEKSVRQIQSQQLQPLQSKPEQNAQSIPSSPSFDQASTLKQTSPLPFPKSWQ